MAKPTITGELIIGASEIRGSLPPFRAVNPATGREFGPEFGTASDKHVALAAGLAWQAFDAYRAASIEVRSLLLNCIARNIEELGSDLIDYAELETGMPRLRLEGELFRTVAQLRLFSSIVSDGRWLSAAIDTPLPSRIPPRPDLRLQKIGLGPVAVFGSSNFPLAFSVGGGDTAAALAAGCPVIVKAHGAHPGTSEMVARAIRRAVAEVGVPEGVFSMLHGDGRTVGIELVRRLEIKAVGFTGSRQAGMALMATAAQRKEPIPVYAEMSSVNPVFLLPNAMREYAVEIARGFVDSLMISSGQLCTNPGLVVALDDETLAKFRNAVITELESRVGGTMLTPGIFAMYGRGTEDRGRLEGVRLVAQSGANATACGAPATIFETSAVNFMVKPELEEEIFGASSLIIRCEVESDFIEVAELIAGQLTATMFIDRKDHPLARRILPTLERKVGRILVNGFPTGVEVSHAMTHGGPFPATSDSRTTSVGAAAIDRFLRPVTYQNLPDELLPEPVQDRNPLKIPRILDGKMGYD